MDNQGQEINCIIWDCDGCLIDSEILACSVSASLLADFGYNISPQEYIDRFAGKGIRHTLAIIEQETGKEITPHFPFEQLHQKREILFRQSLQAIEGVEQVLEQINIPMCVASGSEFNRLYLTLEITKLKDKFRDKIFSSEQVEKGKPAPDLFLFAAQKMKVPPTSCLVIEDSASGIKAAKAAGMKVFGFVGASHASEDWKQKIKSEKPDIVFDNMNALPNLLPHYFQESDSVSLQRSVL